MQVFSKKKVKNLGLVPGELVHVGEEKITHPVIRLMDYNRESLTEDSGKDVLAQETIYQSVSLSWINIDGLHDLELMKKIREDFSLHPLVMADILNTELRPKIEEIDEGLFIVLKMLRFDDETKQVLREQVSIILRNNYLLSFQERKGDVFEAVRERIRNKKGRIVNESIDYLAYSLMDAIVDNYILVTEKIGSEIEDLEEELLQDHSGDTLETITYLKRELIHLRKSIRPAREAIQFLNKCENEIIREITRPFLKDLQANVLQVSDTIDSYKEMAAELMNTYNSLMGNRLNDIMRLLTIFSVIFIPLTFIAGIYGTNFDIIPELHWRFGYLYLWIAFVVVTVGMIIYFKKKKWF